MIKLDDLKKGDVIEIVSGHPWSGNTAEVIRFESTIFGLKPLAKLVTKNAMNGHKVLLMAGTVVRKIT